jgi:hypothetical protein
LHVVCCMQQSQAHMRDVPSRISCQCGGAIGRSIARFRCTDTQLEGCHSRLHQLEGCHSRLHQLEGCHSHLHPLLTYCTISHLKDALDLPLNPAHITLSRAHTARTHAHAHMDTHTRHTHTRHAQHGTRFRTTCARVRTAFHRIHWMLTGAHAAHLADLEGAQPRSQLRRPVEASHTIRKCVRGTRAASVSPHSVRVYVRDGHDVWA